MMKIKNNSDESEEQNLNGKDSRDGRSPESGRVAEKLEQLGENLQKVKV